MPKKIVIVCPAAARRKGRNAKAIGDAGAARREGQPPRILP